MNRMLVKPVQKTTHKVYGKLMPGATIEIDPAHYTPDLFKKVIAKPLKEIKAKKSKPETKMEDKA